MTAAARDNLAVRDLGRLGYAAALAVQHETHAAVLAGDAPGTLLLVEHDPVITVSQRKGAGAHLLADSPTLARLGIEVQPTDRGGDITYHGPGQLVAYPILRLADHGLNLGRYMRLLEEVVIATVATWGVRAMRVDGCTGVWVGAEGGCRVSGVGCREEDDATARTLASSPHTPHPIPDTPATPAKLCALGVRVRKNVTLHGLALNVTTDMAHFATIVPCGLVGRGVTSLHQLLGNACPDMPAVKAALVDAFRHRLYHLRTELTKDPHHAHTAHPHDHRRLIPRPRLARRAAQ